MTEHRPQSSAQRGFTLVEVMIAIAVLTIGILSMAAVLGMSVRNVAYAEEELIARQKALQALESVYTARNTSQITFAQIANTPSGIFTQGATQLLCAGPDGLVNTTDDVSCPASGPCAAGPECVVLPGPDGVLGTADDVAMSLSNFTRQIAISSVLEADGVTVNPTLKSITVTITYAQSGAAPQSYTVQSLISAYN